MQGSIATRHGLQVAMDELCQAKMIENIHIFFIFMAASPSPSLSLSLAPSPSLSRSLVLSLNIFEAKGESHPPMMKRALLLAW